MTDAILGLFGPLAQPECLRASRRGWLIWLRLVPALGAGLVAFLVAWFWATFLDFDRTHLPHDEIRVGLTAIVGGLIALAALIAPAVLAGSLAGEKERGSIALLLSTQASAADIVLSRWVGRLAPLGLVAAASLPPLLWLATLAGLSLPVALMLVGLPLAVGLGGGGFALGVSAVSKRGRDALLLIYLVDVGLMLGSIFGRSAGGGGAVTGSWWGELAGAITPGVFNPFAPLVPLAWGERTAPAAATALAWTLLGLGGLGVACWRLRPSCLDDGAGARKAGRERRRWGHRVPPVGARPMLWKELHIERAGSLGRVGRWVGGLLILWLGLGSLVLGGLVVQGVSRPASVPTEPWAVATLGNWYGDSAPLIGFLIQWAVGLRAAVAIASERERGTWDGLLTSPLEGAEIVRGKLWGSLHALRWLIAAALLAWTITWAADAMPTRLYLSTLAETLLGGILMAAGGVAFSLRSATATRAMGATLAGWLGSFVALKAVALVACLFGAGLCLLAWMYLVQFGLIDFRATPWFPVSFNLGIECVFCGASALLAALVVLDTRLRFDRTAGRMTGGAGAVAVDAFLHGRPLPPVRIHVKPAKAGIAADWEAEMMAPPAG